MRTILIVDDRPIERHVLATILGYADHRLLEAADGLEALAVIASDPPDLIIADILMPTMDGFEFVRRLRADPVNAHIPVIFCTASYLEREAKALAEQCGVSHIIVKPCEPELVFKTVNAALSLPSTIVIPPPVHDFREQHLQLLTAKAAEQSGRLDILAPRLAALVELGQQLALERNPKTLLQIFCDTVRDITGAKYAAVAIMDERGETIEYMHTSGMSDEESARIGSPPTAKGLIHHLLIEREPVRIDDVTTDPRAMGFPENHPPMHSFLGARIMTATRSYGSVYVTEKLGGTPFNDEDNQIIATLALQAGIAYENAQRHDALQREIAERKQAQDELMALYNATSYLFKSDSLLNLGHQIVQAVIQEFKQSNCGIALIDRKQNRIIQLARSGDYDVNSDAPLALDGPGLAAEAARTGKVIYAPDVTRNPSYVASEARTRSKLVVPLRTMSRVVGLLDLQSEVLDAFSERDQRVVAAFADRAANAVQILQLYEELNVHIGELEWRVAQRTAELYRAKEHVEAILNNTSDAVIVLGNDDYAIRQTNPAFTELFGYPREQVFGQTLDPFFTADNIPKLSEALAAAVTGQSVKHVELVGQHQNGSEIRVDVGLSPVRDEQGQIANIVCTFSDITERKRAEEELQRALQKERELNELKTRFVSVVSHEFRTPLSVILSSSEMIKHYYKNLTDEKRVEHLDKIQAHVKHLTQMLDEVLMLSKAEMAALPFNPAPIELETFCREIVAELQQTVQTSHQILFSSTEPCIEVSLDEILMRQVFTNLLTNAIKYSPDGGNVYLEVGCHGGQALIRVKDEGVGIPKEDQERLFEAFFRAKNVGRISGTGLGLNITRRAVEQHSGTIDFESELGVGTTFTIRLPIA